MHEQSQPAEVVLPGQFNNLPPVPYHPLIPQLQDFEPESIPVPLSHYIWILRRNLWKIVAFVASCVLSTAILTSRLQPVYEATATVDVDRQAPSEVVGQDSTRGN